jgi:integrase
MRPDNYGRLFVYMQPENALAVRVSLETGMRIGDVLELKPENIKGRTIHYVADKTGKAGKAVITKDLADKLAAVSGEFYIWPKRGEPNEHRTRQAVWADVKKAASCLRAAGLLPDVNITPHSARKTFAVDDCERHGILHTQKALQHSNKATTKLYVYSEEYLSSLTDNFILKALIKEIHELIEIVNNTNVRIDKLLSV